MGTNEDYRRGTVLGMTIAEVFILLVFLMLLSLAGMNRYWTETLAPWKSIIANSKPQDVEIALAQPDELQDRVDELSRQINELEEEKESLQRRIRTLIGKQSETMEQLDSITQTIAERDREIASLKAKNPVLGERFDLQKENVALKNQINMFGKGTNPPCWYRRVKEANPYTNADWREKAYNLFHIAVRDNHMELQLRPIPEGNAVGDSHEPYILEATELGLDNIPFGVPLSDKQVEEILKPIFDRGQELKVRTYPCTFYALVWDETSEGAKIRWQDAHDGILETYLGTYPVQEVTWRNRKSLITH